MVWIENEVNHCGIREENLLDRSGRNEERIYGLSGFESPEDDVLRIRPASGG